MLKAIVVSALFLSVPLVSFAETTISKQLCSYAPQRIIKPPEFNPDATKSLLSKSVANTDFCSDNRITLTPLGAVVEETTCICQKTDSAVKNKEILDGIGCGQDQTQPKITISIDKKISGCKNTNIIISKCAKDPKAAYEAQCQSGYASPDDLDETPSTVTIDRIPWSISDLPTFSVPDEQQAMVSALTRAGVPPSEAQRLSSEQPQSAQDYIRALVEGNPEEIKATAQKLQINPNLSSSVRSLTQDSPPPSTDSPGREPEDAPRPGVTGFNTGQGVLKCGGRDLASGIAFGESGCGANVSEDKPGARGLHGFMCPSWNSFAQATGYGQYTCACSGYNYAARCPYINDPAIANAVVNRRYEMYQQQYGGMCASIGKEWNNCAYMMHFFGEAGFQRMVAVYRNDPNTPMTREVVDRIVQPGAYDSNRNVFLTAQTADGVFQYLNTKLNGGQPTMGYSTPTGVSSPTGAGIPANTLYSPFALSGNASASLPPLTMSPFANASLFSGLLGTQQPYRIPYQQPVGQQPIVQPPVQQSKPQVTLTVDPHIGKAGDLYTFKWSSSAINSQVGCTLALPGSTTVPVAPSGNQTIAIKKAQIYTLVFSCRGLDGTNAVAQDTVFVQ